MSDQTIDTKQLRELLAKESPAETGLWYCDKKRFKIFGDSPEGLVATATSKGYAELIVTLRNAAPALLDELDRLRELVGGAAATLTWASGAFQSDEESEAWTKLASPVLKRLLAALQEGQQ